MLSLNEIHQLPNIYGDEMGRFDAFNTKNAPLVRIHADLTNGLHGEALKRLHGNLVSIPSITLPNGETINLSPDDRYFNTKGIDGMDIKQAFETDDWSGLRYRIPASSSDGRKTGYVTIDFANRTVMVEYEHSTTLYGFAYMELKRLMLIKDEGCFAVRVCLNLDPLNNEQPALYPSNNEVIYKGIINQPNLSGDAVYDAESNYLPNYPLNLSEVARLTGVANSTLSALKHGNKKVENLPMTTASALTHYADLRRFDAKLDVIYHHYTDETLEEMIADESIDMELREILKSNRGTNDLDTGYTIHFKNGESIDFCYDNPEDARKEYTALTDRFTKGSNISGVMGFSPDNFPKTLGTQNVYVQLSDITHIVVNA